jgi:hypothetical protein
MNDYQKNIELFKNDLQALSNQTIKDVNDILMNKSIVFQYKRTDTDIVIFLFEYDYELLGLSFYGLDKDFNQYTEQISIPTKFPDENWKNITQQSIYKFENEKVFKIYSKGDDSDKNEEELFNEYLTEKNDLFESWFCDCWKKASRDIQLRKGVYFSIHDTNERLDLSSMTEITHEEIINRHK